jgi:DNA polymerase-3 subunit alpha
MRISFSCGCSFDAEKTDSGLIKTVFDINNISLECSRTWDLISSGNTKGVFQLESRLGQSMAKKLKPENIEQLSALISIMRPGCLEAFRDGKSVSNHYIDKKNGEESLDFFHPSLEKILKTTYGEMIYQEQAMEIAKDIAGFDLQEADMLRKAIGKKKPEEMAKIKSKFKNGCSVSGEVSDNEAEQIFGWIEKSQRYSFNKSHAVSYALNAYISAYTKSHFPEIFFLSYLRLAKDKIKPQEEILDLIVNAKSMDIFVLGPDIRLKNEEFGIYDKKIYFGLTNIKNVGSSVFIKLFSIIENLDLQNMSFAEILLKVLLEINSSSAKSLILSGALDYLKISRSKMLREFDLFSQLTKKETEKCCDIMNIFPKYSTFDILNTVVLQENKINKNRKKKILSILEQIKNPPYSLEDSIEWISDNEKELLGISITCSKTDSYNTSYTNADCNLISSFDCNKQFYLVAEINSSNVIKTKRGNNPGQDMCFIKLSDSYGTIDCVVFPETYKEYKELLIPGRVLVFNGQKSKKDNTPIIKKCFVI